MSASSGVAQNGAYVFEGRKVTLPVIVRKARAAAVTYVVILSVQLICKLGKGSIDGK